MIKSFLMVVMLLLFASSLFSDLKAEEGGGIHLSFDDRHIDLWYDARYLFIKYNAKVTFFVSGFGKSSRDEVKKLQVLKNDGHEITSHSLHHKDVNGEATDGGYGAASEVKRYIQEEINPVIKLMTKEGFTVMNHAVPFNRRNPIYLDAVKQKFYFVRVGAWLMSGGGDITKVKNAYYTCNDQLNNRRTLYAFGDIGDNDKYPLSLIFTAMEYAQQTNSVVSLYSHLINGRDNHPRSISIEKLEAILRQAVEMGLKFYTTTQLRTHCL